MRRWDEWPLRKWDMRGNHALALADALFTNMAALELGQVRSAGSAMKRAR